MNTARTALAAIIAVLVIAVLLSLCACGGSDKATGASFTPKTTIDESSFNQDAAQTDNGASIDTSSVSEGFVAVRATSQATLKFQVICGNDTTNYDLPNTGEAIACPLTSGDGSYTFRVMQNTQGNNYVELFDASADVQLSSEFAPFLRPNVYCNYAADSACVTKARELV